MNRIVNFLQKYFAVISVLIGISILLSVTFSSYVVTSNNHKAAEMYIGELKYSMEIDGSTTNTLTVPTGETIVDVKVNNLNPVDTYYKLLYLKNTNITVKYYESTKDTNEVVTTYNKPNDSVTSSNSNTIKLQITNSSTSSQNIALTMKGGYITNTVEDITTPSTYSEITLADTSTNTYFCKTNSTLTQGLNYNNGQYTYAYKQQGASASSGLGWSNITNNGWGVQLTDKASTDAVTSKLCTYINDKPVTSMSYMFWDSQALRIDLSNFNTSNVYNMGGMFSSSQATTLDLSHFDTSNVTNMGGMFQHSQATTLDLSNFDTSNVTNMQCMLCDSQASTIDLSHFDTSNVTNMNSMFWNSKAITIGVSHFDTSKVTNMNVMFGNSQATTIDVSHFDTSNVTNMQGMFQHSQATIIDVSNFDTSNVTNMQCMFCDSKAATLDLSHFDTSNVTNMQGMFWKSQATTLDVSHFDTSNVTNMEVMFAYMTNLKTIYASSKFVTTSVTSSTSMFEKSTNLVGGAGTKYNKSYLDKTYARIDGGTSNPGYFTEKPSTFSTDSWATIVSSVKAGNTRGYKVGETKTIDLGTTYGTHTLRIANTTTPSECNASGFSQSACGFVLEFADIILYKEFNSSTSNTGGWSSSELRTFINNDIYNALPVDLRNIIIDTIVVSGHGKSDSTNFVTTDKLYLLAPKEIFSNWSNSYDTAKSLTRTFDYYISAGVTTSNYSGAKKYKGTSAYYWWLRSAYSTSNSDFFRVNRSGGWSGSNTATAANGVSPAFRIG
jgi:surface protein